MEQRRSHVKQIPRAFIFRKGTERKGGKGIPFSHLMGEHRTEGRRGRVQPGHLGSPGSRLPRSLRGNLFLLHPSTKAGTVSGHSWRSFEGQAGQWALCHPPGLEAQEVDRSQGPESWSCGCGTEVVPGRLAPASSWLSGDCCLASAFRRVMSFLPLRPFCLHHPLTPGTPAVCRLSPPRAQAEMETLALGPLPSQSRSPGSGPGPLPLP